MAEYEHPELRNLVDSLSEEELTKIAEQVVEDYEADWQSGEQWRRMHADWLSLYFQHDEAKNPPWEGSSRESIPMLAEACGQFHSRAFQAMFPSKNIIKAAPTGKADPMAQERGERVARHMSWQLMVNDKTYKPNKDRLLLGLPLHGSVFTKTFFDPTRRRNVTQNVRCIDLVVPYGTGPRDLEDLERKTQVIYMPLHTAALQFKSGYFSSMPEPHENEQASEQDNVHDEVSGFNNSGDSSRNPAKILEQHTYLDLDGDGIPDPYVITVDATARKVLRLTIRWETDEAGQPTDGKKPVEYFTHYAFMENPDGFYGLGYGHLLGPINTAVNKLLRQVIDAGTLANVGNHSGFVSKALSGKKGEVEFQLGKFVSVENTVQDIRQGIYQFSFPGPNATHFNVIDLLMSRGDRLATVTEAITGQTESVMQPTTVLALIEQSLKVFSTVYERVLTAWQIELMKHFRLNFKYMDPVEYFAINDVGGNLQDVTASREDYADDLQIEPLADPKMSTDKQRFAKAETELQISLQNPLVVNSPVHLYNVYRRFYSAIGVENVDEILPNVIQQQLPQVDDPMLENKGALMNTPMVPPAMPDQDHQMHIQAHAALLNDPEYGPLLSTQARQVLVDHIQAHNALLYGMVDNNAGTGSGSPQMAQAAGMPGLLNGASGPVSGGLQLVDGGSGEAPAPAGPGAGN